ncbi:Surfeit locus protein 1-like [Oopsacas minuta]|uniref:SURF1-like protein n=1 Tax=Oopsacas minuta TaxID=111878 RepID=A0AAV7JZ11_9METZ|nr:Surfeit locus protein 1-like [Oopsacas minuta]
MNITAKLRRRLYIIPVTTFILGTWQIYRLRWKLDLISKMKDRTTREPIPIPSDLKHRCQELLYSHVSLSGNYDHSSELYLFPRPFNADRIALPTYRPNHPGIQVITPFYCNELKARILVNRGWIPKQQKNPNTRQEGQLQGEVTLVGMVRDSSKSFVYSGKNRPEINEWQYVDVNEMSGICGTEPIILDCSYESSIQGGPIGGQTNINIRNKHVEYICVWYGLTVVIGYILFKSRASLPRKQFPLIRNK